MNNPIEVARDDSGLQFRDARGVLWTTGIGATEQGRPYRWFQAIGRQERRYELRNGEAKDESTASLREQLHASVPIEN